MEYKTLRYPGHARSCGRSGSWACSTSKPVEVKGQTVVPRDVFIAAVSPAAPQAAGPRPRGAPGRGDRARRTGSRRGSRSGCIDYYDAEHGISAMMRTTGYSLSITGQMQADGRVTREGRAHARRGDAVPGLRGGAGQARRPDRGTVGRAGGCSGGHDATSRRCGRARCPTRPSWRRATQHKGLWEGIYRIVPAARLGVPARCRPASKRQLLVIAEDWCGDASSTVPILAQLRGRGAGTGAPHPAARRASRADGPLSHQRLALHPDRDRAGRRASGSWATGARGRARCRRG